MDRFGKHADIFADGENARVKVNVRVSPQFFGWIAGLGGAVTIAGPQSLIKEYKTYLQSLIDGLHDNYCSECI